MSNRFAICCGAILAVAVTIQPSKADPAPPSPGSAPQAPVVQMPGPTTEIIGPDGVFRLKPDGATWARFQTVRAIGVSCTDKACGGDRVFCMIQVRKSESAKAGEAPPAESAKKFGDGVIANTPKELKADYVTPFAEKTLGGHPGQWADAKAEGDAGSIRFGLFLVEAKAHEIAFNCVSPSAGWDKYKPRFETLLASIEIPK